jgi:catechol 2,3-dioxygenase-like lactoylglutathione lyase family enzyme
MRSGVTTVVTLTMAAALGLFGRSAQLQTPVRIGTAPLGHIGVAVKDVDAAAKAYAEVLDLPVPTINEKNALAQPDGSEAAVARAATFGLPNFLIELQQSKTTFGPIHDTFSRYGMTVHHLSFGVKDQYGDARQAMLQQHGARWTGGTKDSGWSYVDLREALGATFEPITIQIHQMLDKRYVTGNATRMTLGTTPVACVGIVVRNAEQAARAYADVLGIPVPAVTSVQAGPFPGGSKANPKATVKRAAWTHDNGIEIELLEPVGAPSPWADALERQKGNAVHHLTFAAGDRLPDLIRLLEAKGGRLVYGSAASGSAYLDFTDKLGIVIELVK